VLGYVIGSKSSGQASVFITWSIFLRIIVSVVFAGFGISLLNSGSREEIGDGKVAKLLNSLDGFLTFTCTQRPFASVFAAS
jgi:hypothetical protein